MKRLSRLRVREECDGIDEHPATCAVTRNVEAWPGDCACALELTASGIPFAQQMPISVWYNGRRLSTSYRPDFLCFDALLVEIKALQRLGGAEVAQVLCYLKAMGLSRALLLNFGAPRLEYRRLVRTPDAMR